jgi:(S)-beta-macrocarpene synthase
LLSLYNAAYLRTRDEEVLDQAIPYTTRRLQEALPHLESPLVMEVSSFLDIPLFKKVGIIEARNYIPIYEKEYTRNEVVLEFAKLNFNLQQLVFCQEIKECMM